MCDFLGYEIKERLRMKKFIEEKALVEERELETTRLEERPITISLIIMYSSPIIICFVQYHKFTVYHVLCLYSMFLLFYRSGNSLMSIHIMKK
jgi:hypothetical protein